MILAGRGPSTPPDLPEKMADRRRTEVTCRALGLGLVFSVYSKLRGHNLGGELEKIAFDKNRWLAALCCVTHIVAVSPTIVLAYINISSYYIGAELQGLRNQDQIKLAFLQVVAKLHELLINASLAKILLSYLRYELAFGYGLPFGALHGGSSFTEVSYLWSKEFWATCFSKDPSRPFWRKFALIAILFITVALATTAAPASAIAILPQLNWWDAGSSSYWLNASTADLFPSIVNESFSGGTVCTQPGGAPIDSCPGGGWASARVFASQLVDRTATNAIPWTVPFGDHSSFRIMNVSTSLGYYQTHYGYYTTATVPHLSIARSVAYMNHNWRDRMVLRYQQFLKKAGDKFDIFRDALFQVDSKQAITRVQCSDLKLRTLNDQSNLYFPNQEDTGYPGTFSSFEPDVNFLDDVLGSNSSTSYPWTKTTFVTLPQKEFGPSSIGVIVTLPKLANASGVWYTTCLVDARWADSNTFTTITPHIEQAVLGLVPGWDGSYLYTEQASGWPSSWQPITLTNDWAYSALLPIINITSGQDAFQDLTETAGITGVYDSMAKNVIEALTAVWITSALSRIGSQATVQGTLKANLAWVGEWIRNGAVYDVDESSALRQNWSKLRMSVQVQGYAYALNGVSIYLALAVLLAHAFLAVCHVFYCVLSGRSSKAWEELAEITALAMNSAPSKALENTCAGINKLDTMKTNVKIVATGEDEKHLILKFTPEKDLASTNTPAEKDGRVETNKEYGGIS